MKFPRAATAAACALAPTGMSALLGGDPDAVAAGIEAAGLTPAGARFASQFAAAESQFNLPSGMLAAVAQQESIAAGGQVIAVRG